MKRSGWLLVVLFLTPTVSWGGNLSVDVSLTPAGRYKAETNKVNGFAYRTQDGVAAKNVVIDLGTITTGVSVRDKHTRERLMVEKYPQAKLVSATGKNGKGNAIIEIKGKQHEVVGTYNIDGETLRVQFPLTLADLEITDARYMGIGVKDTVTINIELPIKAAPLRETASEEAKD